MRKAAPLLLLLLSACMTLPPPVEREPTVVAANFDATWNAVIDMFASRNVPISTMDKNSGFIASNNLQAGAAGYPPVYVCVTEFGMQVPASLATYNVVVRPVGDRTTVKTTISWQGAGLNRCATTGEWENTFETAVKTKAEGR
jgi:hypothetical protein